MNYRIRLILSQDEFDALRALSLLELRAPADEARMILRQGLEQRGLLACPQKGPLDPKPGGPQEQPV